ncbi:hypothetical protein D3C72_1993340 [compost metagenome]
MYIFHGNSVSYMIVPYGKHAAPDFGMPHQEYSISDLIRFPAIVKTLNIQKIVIITSGWHNIKPSIGCTDLIVAQAYHFFRLCVAIVPGIHGNIIGSYRCCALRMG